jgi:Fuc2NAc and GlcNAc transferase
MIDHSQSATIAPPLAALAAALASYLLCRLLIRHGARMGLHDLPNFRSSHQVPKPRGGGTGIVVAFLLVLPLGLPAHAVGGWSVWLPLAAAIMLALVGLADDLRGLGLSARLGAQCLAVATVLAALGWSAGAGGESDLGLLAIVSGLPDLVAWLSAHTAPWVMMALDFLLLPLLVLTGLWWINLFNFMDGIDGIAASQALFMLLGAILLRASGSGTDLFAAPASAAALLLAGAVAGFLLLNWAPARLFMGDSGSLFLGFSIFALAAHDVTFGDISFWTWLLLGTPFIVDATVTLLRRWTVGQAVTSAHRSHLYQRLSRRWNSHAAVVLVYCLFDIVWVLPLAFLSDRVPQWAPVILGAAWLPVAVLAWRAGAGLVEAEGGR